MEERKYFLPDHVAERLQVDRKTVYKMVRSGELPALRIGRQWRIPPDALDSILSTQMDLRLKD